MFMQSVHLDWCNDYCINERATSNFIECLVFGLELNITDKDTYASVHNKLY